MNPARFGSHDYSKAELVAEMTAAYTRVVVAEGSAEAGRERQSPAVGGGVRADEVRGDRAYVDERATRVCRVVRDLALLDDDLDLRA